MRELWYLDTGLGSVDQCFLVVGEDEHLEEEEPFLMQEEVESTSSLFIN